ncbi:30S ribosomal protein S13 [Durusdinium trenchii]
MPAVKSEVKKSGRCASLITQALQCSAAAGGQGLDDFADFTEQGTDTKRPPGCYYYHDEITAPQSKGYQELPVKVMRVALNLLSDGAQADYSRFADFSAKTPCLCKVV